MAGTRLYRLCEQGLRVEISSMRWDALRVQSGGVTLLFLAASGLGYGTQDLSWCDVRSFVVVRDSLAAVQGLSSLVQDSLVAARELSSLAACGILVPRPGVAPAFPELQGRFLTSGPGKSQSGVP